MSRRGNESIPAILRPLFVAARCHSCRGVFFVRGPFLRGPRLASPTTNRGETELRGEDEVVAEVEVSPVDAVVPADPSLDALGVSSVAAETAHDLVLVPVSDGDLEEAVRKESQTVHLSGDKRRVRRLAVGVAAVTLLLAACATTLLTWYYRGRPAPGRPTESRAAASAEAGKAGARRGAGAPATGELGKTSRKRTAPSGSAAMGGQEGFRTWRDAAGAREVRAKFLRVAGQSVELEREDGTVVYFPVNRLDLLSDEDQAFVQRKTKLSTASPPGR